MEPSMSDIDPRTYKGLHQIFMTARCYQGLAQLNYSLLPFPRM